MKNSDVNAALTVIWHNALRDSTRAAVMELEEVAVGAMPRLGDGPRLSIETRIGLLLEALPIALVLTGSGGVIEFVNREAEQMFGYDRTELRGSSLDILIPDRFRARCLDLRRHFPASVSAGMVNEGEDLFGLRKNGTEFPLEIGFNPFELDGEPMMLAGVIDTTARRDSEREKERQRCELAQSNADLEEFAYAASHDLKAPMRAIANLAQWIDEDIEPTANPDTLDNLKLLRARVARLERLLDGLLAYSRVGHTQTPVEEVDVAELAREIVAMLAPSPGFVVTCEGTMSPVRTHRMPIQTVLKNLIDNALKHHDRAEGHVTIAMRLIDGVAEFRVSDDGPGIPPRFHERIFVIFQTLQSRDDTESSGVGLAIVKKKVQRNGGQIRVESAPPARGTTFIFTWNEDMT